MKKVGKYILILALLLAGLFFIALLFLFFIPDSSLFGITYIGKGSQHYSQAYAASGVNTIVINNSAFNVEIVTVKDSDKISLLVENRMFGFTLKKHSAVTISPKLFKQTLTFNIEEPYGVAFKNGSYIELRIPANMVKDPTSAYGFNLTLNNSSSKSNINCEQSAINNLKFTTKSGSLNINKGAVTGNISLDLSRGSCNIANTSTLNSNNVTLKQTSGSFSTEDKVVLGNINHTQNTTGDVDINVCNNYIAPLNTAGGNISIQKVNNELELTSTDTNLYVKEQNSGGIKINLTESGAVTIDKINAAERIADITTKNGSINIKNSRKNLKLITTNSGSITATNIYAEVSATSNRGNINISYAKDAANFDYTNPNSSSRKATINTQSGTVNVSGVQNINLTITKNGNATVNMNEVYGNNKISAQNGSVKVVTPSNRNVETTHKYNLTTQSDESGTVYVAISGVEEYTTKASKTIRVGVDKDSTEEIPHNLDVKVTSGSLRVVNSEYDY